MRKIECVFCDSDQVELFSLFGQTLLGSQYYCNNCKSIFEAVRFDDDDLENLPPATSHQPPELNTDDSPA